MLKVTTITDDRITRGKKYMKNTWSVKSIYFYYQILLFGTNFIT